MSTILDGFLHNSINLCIFTYLKGHVDISVHFKNVLKVLGKYFACSLLITTYVNFVFNTITSTFLPPK